jgi:outer membrane protein TolC
MGFTCLLVAAALSSCAAGELPFTCPTPLPFAEARELAAEAVVAQVLARNPTLAQMAAAWEEASTRYPQVTSLDDPMLSGMVAPASIGSREVEFGYRLEVSQKFPFPGKRPLRGQSALAEASAAGHELEDSRLQLIEAAQLAFSDYFLADRAREVNEEGVRLLQSLREIAVERFKNGLVPQQDVLLADVELGRQRERSLNLERIRRVAVARLNTLMHLPPTTPLPPPPKQLIVEPSLPPAEPLHARAVEARPDLKALADRVAAEQASVALALREYYPDVEAIAAYDTIMGNGPTRDLAAQIGFRVNLPFRKTRRGAAVAEAQARVARRQAELAGRTDQVHFQVQEAYEQLSESQKVVALYEKTILPAARENVQAAQSGYITAKISFLNLVEAQRNLVNLRERHYEALAEYHRRRATLERVTGGPLQPPELLPEMRPQVPVPPR